MCAQTNTVKNSYLLSSLNLRYWTLLSGKKSKTVDAIAI